MDSGNTPTVDAALKAIFHSDPAAYQAWQNSLQVRVDAQSVGTASANALAQTAYEGTVGQFVQMDWRDSGSMAEVWRHNSQLHAAWRQAVQLPNPSSVHVVTKTAAAAEAELLARVEVLKSQGVGHVEAWGQVFSMPRARP